MAIICHQDTDFAPTFTFTFIYPITHTLYFFKRIWKLPEKCQTFFSVYKAFSHNFMKLLLGFFGQI